MSLVKWGFIGLLALPVAELVVFIVVALSIGWLLALALFLATSLIGMMVLKRSGADLHRFRSDLARQGAGAIHLETPSLAAMIGGILLVVSGLYHRYRGRAAVAAMGPALGRQGDRPPVCTKPVRAPRAPRSSIWSPTSGIRFLKAGSTTKANQKRRP